ncbi:Med1p [Saccharomyces cerevisiae x Saccharomyces kudriavzevii VIN7]|uniref:Med1p n=1 Tax=Saccharomyces cerevisiae x Saccharomyces kudriavzevii (strain VIN7) TaxID=1095631 RepID=H0H2E3_SACCK|nr:Med1p [Saccharomyces cerevisiae x Saccharomyces kudriavzevii VIN7]
MVEVDSYVETLNSMIELFKDYKPGSITLENITRLCQTLGLESFTEELSSELSRLSTASKIIVIDVDYNKKQDRIQDVKLVLASNFDNFDYFNQQEGEQEKSNILLNSLTKYPDLKSFHNNLKVLYLLDAYSHIESDSSSHNNTSDKSLDSSNTSLNNQGKLDLFKYFTELSHYIRQSFHDNSLDFKVKTNLNNQFGIYILTQEENGQEISLAKIYLDENKTDSQNRFYEYIYSQETKSWINESAENFSNGISLVMEITANAKENDCTELIWFPEDFISPELIIDTTTSASDLPASPPIIDLLSNNNYNSKIQLMNDFTTKLININKFDISNDNLDLISEILKWIEWSRIVLQKVFKLVSTPNSNTNSPGFESDHTAPFCNSMNDKNFLTSITEPILRANRHGSVVEASRRRRSSANKSKRPSVTESMMLKEEGLQQFNLHEILSEPAIEEENDEDNTKEQPVTMDCTNDLRFPGSVSNQHSEETDIVMENQSVPQGVGNDTPSEEADVKMKDVSGRTNENDLSVLQLIVSEDHIILDAVAECNLYDDIKCWKRFIEQFEDIVS